MKEVYYATMLTSAKSSPRLDTLEIFLKLLTKEIKTLSEDLGTFTRLFKLSIQQDMNIGVDILVEDTNAPVGKHHNAQKAPKPEHVNAAAGPSATFKYYVELKL